MPQHSVKCWLSRDILLLSLSLSSAFDRFLYKACCQKFTKITSQNFFALPHFWSHWCANIDVKGGFTLKVVRMLLSFLIWTTIMHSGRIRGELLWMLDMCIRFDGCTLFLCYFMLSICCYKMVHMFHVLLVIIASLCFCLNFYSLLCMFFTCKSHF